MADKPDEKMESKDASENQSSTDQTQTLLAVLQYLRDHNLQVRGHIDLIFCWKGIQQKYISQSST